MRECYNWLKVRGGRIRLVDLEETGLELGVIRTWVGVLSLWLCLPEGKIEESVGFTGALIQPQKKDFEEWQRQTNS